jgi:RNA polymerase sigma-70 factor (ECF subfamily)
VSDEIESATPVERWIREAGGGSGEALGQLLELCRPYLILVAHQHLSPNLRAKVSPSDLVQDTCLEAQRDFARFTGSTEDDLLAWLRRILLNNLANVRRHYQGTDKRQLDREVALADAPSGELANHLPADEKSPSAQAQARERDEELQRALARLPEATRQIIHWRNYERLTFEEVGRRLDKSAEAVRKTWARAIGELGKLLQPPQE